MSYVALLYVLTHPSLPPSVVILDLLPGPLWNFISVNAFHNNVPPDSMAGGDRLSTYVLIDNDAYSQCDQPFHVLSALHSLPDSLHT